MYKVLREENRRFRLQTVTMAVILRRLTQDIEANETKIDKLEAARIYMKDRLDNQHERIEELVKQIADQSEKAGDLKDVCRAKDSKFKQIGQAIEELKNRLIWGKFSGNSNELDEMFEDVLKLLD